VITGLEGLPGITVRVVLQWILQVPPRARSAWIGAVAGSTPPATAGRRLAFAARLAIASSISASAFWGWPN